LHYARADTELPADLEDAVARGLQFANSCLNSGLNPTPTELGPIRPRARQESLLVKEQADPLFMEALEYADGADPLNMSRPCRTLSRSPPLSSWHQSLASIPAISAANPSILVDLDYLLSGSLRHRL
jgi:hypothetical protein